MNSKWVERLVRAALCLAAAIAVSGAQAMSEASRFPGAWRLVSAEYRAMDGTVVDSPWGTEPQGMLIYDSYGNMSAQLGRAGAHALRRQRPAARQRRGDQGRLRELQRVLGTLRGGRARPHGHPPRRAGDVSELDRQQAGALLQARSEPVDPHHPADPSRRTGGDRRAGVGADAVASSPGSPAAGEQMDDGELRLRLAATMALVARSSRVMA